MQLDTIKSYKRTIDSIEQPVRHFVETGFWVEPLWEEGKISYAQVRRVVRDIAKELKRPFIVCGSAYRTYEHRDTGRKDLHGYTIYERIEYDTPRFSHGYVEVPKRKYLLSIVAPLLLLPEGSEYIPVNKLMSPVFNVSTSKLWQFRIDSEEFWNEYYNFALNDPDCRRARKLTS